MHDDDDQVLPPDDGPEPFEIPDFDEDDNNETADSAPAKPTTMSVHKLTPKISVYERQMQRLYLEAASALEANAPDNAPAVVQKMSVITVCVVRHLTWPLVGDETDEAVLEAAKSVTPAAFRKYAALILDRVADEIHAAACAAEALVVLDLLQQEVPARIDNVPVRELCRALTRQVWDLYGSIPGYTERRNRRDGK